MLLFLAKGLFRDRSRSLFPLLTVAIGVSLVVLLDAYQRGAMDGMFRAMSSFVTGHLRVTTNAYVEAGADATNELALLGVDSIMAELRHDFPEVTWTPRTRFGGLVDVPDSTGNTRVQSPAAGLAVDLSVGSPEREILRLNKSLASGRLPSVPGEILLSEEFARQLGLRLGDKLTLVSSTMNGSVATWNFVLSGTVRFGVTAMDRGAMLADIRDIQQALDMPDAADQVLGFMPRGQYDDKLATRLAAQYNRRRDMTGMSDTSGRVPSQLDTGSLGLSTTGSPASDQYAPTMQTMRSASGLGAMFELLDSAAALILAIFVVAMAVVLWNAGLMGSLRRYGEIGVRLAIGESKGAVYRSLLAEAFLVGLVGSAIGTAVGLGFSLYLQEVGFNVAAMMRNATMVIDDVIRARIAPASFIVGFLPGLLATFLGAAISGLGVYKRQTAMLAKELGS
jgi:putative ABC transport system permease protein